MKKPTETGLPFTAMGKLIAVIDEGFVYQGEVTRDGDFYLISRARNIRRWGTTRGLGELRNGPTQDTILDEAGEVLVPAGRVIHFIRCVQGW
jgi:hypothetical protein